MNESSPEWTADAVQRALAQLGNVAPLSQRPEWPLRASAAVLQAFDPETLRPLGPPLADRAAAVRALLEDCEPADIPGHFRLRTSARHRALAELGSRERMREALDANRPSDDQPLQRMLSVMICSKLSSLDDLSTEDLHAALQAIAWVEGILDGVPSRFEIKLAFEARQLLSSFTRMAGRPFAGREREMEQLREFVGVWPPSSALARVRRVLRDHTHRDQSLTITGPGGIGKTALVANVLAQNLALPPEQRVPCGYLDMSRLHLRGADRVALIVEILEALLRQYPRAAATIDSAIARIDASDQPAKAQVCVLGDVLAQLTAPDVPLLLVLDSIEEMEYLGRRGSLDINELVDVLQRHLAAVRIILVGRVAPNRGMRTLVLSGLDANASNSLLESRGIVDAETRRLLISQLGNSPFALWLGAQLVQRGDDVRALRSPLANFFGPPSEAVQALLFGRLVNHIHDGRVRSLARIAAIVRRMTPAVIRTVLGPAAEVDVPSEAAAQELFEGLADEVAFFVPDEYETIRMRPALRQVILPLLRQGEPARVHDIDERAIAHYAGEDGLRSRAEELYHRLAAGHSSDVLDGRWVAGVEHYLASASMEIEGSARDYLRRRLGMK